MDKVIIECDDCNHKETIEFDSLMEIGDKMKKCKKCGSENVYTLDFIWEKEPDRTPIKMGNGGCGSVWR
jgi:DNA replicative helicase MCM subunit Mcm2 (Cdc46/Mcm family)